ncbi:OLC1v1020250C1 [Oldenlandia corymbosa var. corymbosa]|uniref:OLC1v1020250C1 n=1 Tax=Oldenlandia corymbosa var. corymbosa TaxID=529605 RepID=A0AAV1EG42_OLDCO|nr:OLC1v1020250C1 [Oldenlandia corymbosa var. corymbosa]
MESMVAKPCISSSHLSPTMTVQEKGSRNKRKFRAEAPLTDPKIVPEPLREGTTYEFTAENLDDVRGHCTSINSEFSTVKHENAEALQLDLGLSCAAGVSEFGLPKRGVDSEACAAQNADWNDPNESELEKLVYSNLDSNLRNAMRRIVAYGYNEEVVFTALSKAGQCHGMKDSVSNLVDSTLAFIRGDQEIRALRDINFEDILELERYMVAESVCVVKQMKPSASTGEAMWFLLVCDMNISLGCVIETDQMSGMTTDGVPHGALSGSTPVSSSLEHKILDPSLPVKTNGQSKATEVVSNPYVHTFQSEARTSAVSNSSANAVAGGLFSDKDCPTSSVGGKTFSLTGSLHNPISEEKFVTCRKVSGMTKREYVFRQKSLHLEKHHRTYSKVTSRTGKLNHLGSLVLDKKLRHIADSTCLSRNTLRVGNKNGVELAQDNVDNQSVSTTIPFPTLPAFSKDNKNVISPSSEPNLNSSLHPVKTSPALLAADTELSLSLPMENNYATIPVNKVSNTACNVQQEDNSDPNKLLEDKKEEMIQKLLSKECELQNQLQEWTEWANQKVMQAARRLGKDKAELKALRQEKEEVERLKKEKQTLEENTMKKLSEMENALCKASGQVERANAAVRRLEVENSVLRQEMGIAKSRAAASAANLEDVLKREKANMMKVQSQEKQKLILSEELAVEKHKIVDLKQILEQAEDLRNQLEV